MRVEVEVSQNSMSHKDAESHKIETNEIESHKIELKIGFSNVRRNCQTLSQSRVLKHHRFE